MRNYLFSIGTHVIILLLLLGLSFTTLREDEPKLETAHVVMVDFSEEDNKPRVEKKSAPVTKAKKVKPAESSPQKKPAAVQKRTVEKKTLQTSQKPKAETSKVLEEKSKIVKEVIPHADPEPTPEELEAERRERDKAEKRSKFSSLLSQAKNTAAAKDQPETKEEASSVNNTGASSFTRNENIRGVLGNRKVIKSPVIKDQSQKKGRVVVKICVGSDGKVLSSKYTMMGSTTSDSYLINLAEKGARQYLFSTSPNPKECGNVVIDFQLK